MSSESILLLLTGQVEAPLLTARLQRRRPDLAVRALTSREALEALPDELLARARLLAFCTGILVPGRILAAIGHGAYNIHPGTPDFPGWMPASFALYRGATTFGATAHVMGPKVDSGAIVGIDMFPVEAGISLARLTEESYRAAVRLIDRLLPELTDLDRMLPVLPLSWSKDKSTRAMMAALSRLDPDLSPEEIARRKRAFGIE